MKWGDLDWENKRFQIQRQTQRIVGRGIVFAELKTKASKRSIAVGDLTIKKLLVHKEIIEKYKSFAGEHWKENDLIFPSIIGTPYTRRNLLRHFNKIIVKSGLPKIRFHDLRHTAATLMLKQGVHPKIVQERLGHSSIVVTLDTYSHVIPTMQEEVAKNLDLLFSN